MKKEVVFMSKKEVNRLTVIKELEDKLINQEKASEKLKLSTRQIRRLLKSYRNNQEEGLISKKRGKVSNYKIDSYLESKVIELISNNYSDFGPTLATEKLFEIHDIKISKETVMCPPKSRQIVMPLIQIYNLAQIVQELSILNMNGIFAYCRIH